MKKVILLVALATSFIWADGKEVFKKCAVCHGAKGEKVYLNKIPALKEFKDKDKLYSLLKTYRDKNVNTYGMGTVMKISVKGMSDDKLKEVVEYIEDEIL